MDWSKDIYKNKEDAGVMVSCRIPKKYREMIKKNKINLSKLVMRSCEELDKSLKEKKK